MDMLSLLTELGKLKRIPRTGWVKNSISLPEDVADHSWRCALIALLLGPKLHLDTNKLVTMMLVHDVGEIDSGDLIVDTPTNTDSVLQKKKEALELAAFHRLFGATPEYLGLLEEYIAQETPLSHIAKQIDKIEMAIQALEYEKEQNKDLSGFFQNVKRYLKHPEFVSLLDKLEHDRPPH